jgi:hypothetical protein
MNIYEKRWNIVYKFAKKLKDLYDTGNYIIMENGVYLDSSFQIELDVDELYFGFKTDNCRYMIYEGNLDWDHGAYDTIKATKERLSHIKSFKLEEILL